MDLKQLDARLVEIYGRRAWIVLVDVAAAAAPLVADLRRFGAEEIMIVAGSTGVGKIPDDAVCHYLGIEASTVMQAFRESERVLGDPPVELASNLQRFDPAGRAGVIASPLLGIRSLIGRKVYGARPPEWTALEDKTLLDHILKESGVDRAPSRVVEVASASRAAARMAGAIGTVWSADNTEGWHGGGEYTRWVREASDARAAEEWFRTRAKRVRVMPFLDGIPCSIHGYVTRDGVATFRPVEMIITRQPEHSAFFYMGMATTWDPPEGMRAEMRSAALRIGETLRREVSYRGPFSVDGVATADGFRPTELNPRVSAGLGLQATTVEGLPFDLAARASIAGDLDLPARWLDQTVTESADRQRVARMGALVARQIDADRIPVEVAGDRIRPVTAGEGDGPLMIGPSVSGSYVKLRVDHERIPAGSSMAPWAISALGVAADHWGFEAPELVGAPDVSAQRQA